MDGQQAQGGLTDEQLFAQQTQSSPSPSAQPASPSTQSLGKTDEELFLSPQAQIAKKESAATNISHAFNEGFGEATDHYQNLGLSQETQDWVKSSGLYKNVGLMGQAIYDQLILPTSAILDATMRTAVGTTITGPIAAAGVTLHTKAPGLEAFMAGAPLSDEASQHAASGTAEMVLNSPLLAEFGHGAEELPKFTPNDLLRAKASGVLDGEGAYFGTKPLTPEQVKAQEGAAANLPPEPTPEPKPDIHTVARQIAPETFDEYDRLATSRDTLRSRLEFLNEQRTSQAEEAAPHNEEISQLQEKIENANPRKAKIYQSQLDELKAKNDEAITQAKSTDTEEMSSLRTTLQGVDYRMRDLSPKVSEAYRSAQEQIPPDEAVSGEQAQSEAEAKPEEKQETPATAEEKEKEIADTEGHRQAIVADMKKQLVDAGRPEAEADAAANLVAEHYITRADRFGGKLGSPAEMYGRDMADIRAGKGAVKPRELAQENPGVFDKIKDLFTKPETTEEGELEQRARGKIRLATDDARATITLMKEANASTFIHETGHHWLEELLKDADHEAAPDDLKADAETARKWLGNDGGDLSVRQHEQFARGFERYMMEGVAPSKQLAGVFNQFREWLNKIYQSVQKLRAPITDDIRDVFDRLLSKNPEKTVLGAEAEPGKMMANFHEVDAEQTPPEHAEAAADNIREEIKATAKYHDSKEAENVITQAEKTGGSESDSGRAGGPSGAEPGQPPVQEPPAVSGGGGEAAPEGGGFQSAADGSSGDTAGGDGTGSDTKPVTDPNSPAKSKSDLIDKAGNIRLENLTQNEDVRAVMRQAARDNNEFWDARRGVVTDQMVSDLASAMGVADKEMNLQKLREISLEDGIPLAVRIKVGRQMLVQSATAARDAMIKAAQTGSEEDLINLAEARRRHLMIAETVSSVTAEWGRAGRSFRDISKEEGAKADDITDLLQRMTGKSPAQMLEMAKKGGALDTPAQVAKFIQDSKKPSWGTRILEEWTNALISNPATHATYTIGNELLTLWKAIPETAAEAALGKIRKLRGEDGQHTQFGEVGAKLKAHVTALPNALSAAGQALRTGVTTLLPGEAESGTPFQTGTGGVEPGRVGNADISWSDLGSQAFGALKGLKDAFAATGNLVKAGGIDESPLFEVRPTPRGAIENVAVKGIELPVGDVIRSPGRIVAAIHSLYRTLNYSMEKAALAYRTAHYEGLEGDDFVSRINDIYTSPSDKQMDEARGSATQTTLMGQGGDFTKAMSRLTNASAKLPVLGETKLLKFIDPFVKISSNIIEQAILDRTPIGLLSSEVRADLSGVNGMAARDAAQAKMLVGTSFCMTVGTLAAQGFVSGSGPTDPHEAMMWRLAGNQAHSVKIGDVWYDMHRLGPLGMMTSISADMYGVAHAASTEDMSKVSAMLVHAITQNILDESFMRGPADLIKAVSDSDRYGDQYIRNMVSSFVPFSSAMGNIARSVDPYMRQTHSVMDAIKAKIPFASESLMPRRDIWGEPMANKAVLGPPGLSSIYETSISNDPVNQAMMRLGIYPALPERKIRSVKLTDQQYDDYSRISGQLAKAQLDEIVASPNFNQPGTDYKQTELVKKVIEAARENARNIIIKQNPEIAKEATDKKYKLSSKVPAQ